ncbi:MAG TPA: hypothetical protein VJB87_03590 [Candidatus Nanoarchaeia archaeon]|nr:hypothetical protein [Candidatus Nanoarchaeia archaeon]
MVQSLPRNPEAHFDATPKRFSTTSKIVTLTPYEQRSGILVGDIDALRAGITCYVTKVRSRYEIGQKPKIVLQKTFDDLEGRLIRAREEALKENRQVMGEVEQKLRSLSSVTPEVERELSTHLDGIARTLEKNAVYEGELRRDPFSVKVPNEEPIGPYNKSLLEYPSQGEGPEIAVEVVDGKYVIHVHRINKRKGMNGWVDERFEEELAKKLRTQRLVWRAGVQATFDEVDGIWYNIPLLDILRKGKLGYTPSVALGTELEEVGVRTFKELENNLLRESHGVCFGLKSGKENYVVTVDGSHMHPFIQSDKMQESEDEFPDKKEHYAHVSKRNVVGPAWTSKDPFSERRDPKDRPKIERPRLDISLDFPRDGITVFRLPEVDLNKQASLLKARDDLLHVLEGFKA